MKKIIVNSAKYGKKAILLDNEDYEKFSKYKWHIRKSCNTFYAQRTLIKNGKQTTVTIYIEIMNPPKGYVVDHIKGNGLDCRKFKMRICTWLENSRNRKKRRGCISKHKGVHLAVVKEKYKKKNGKKQSYINKYWKSQISIKPNKYIFLGYFKTEIEAALAYNEAAKKYHGEFAKLNIIA